MSAENVEIVRRAYEAFNQGDLEGTLADFAPGFEFVTSGAIPGAAGSYRGPERWRELQDSFWGEFDEGWVEVHDLTEAGDQVLVEMTLRGGGKQSGVQASWHLWHLWTMKDGKVVHGQGFTNRNEALEAAGLSE
jgi:uncharacterized protein